MLVERHHSCKHKLLGTSASTLCMNGVCWHVEFLLCRKICIRTICHNYLAHPRLCVNAGVYLPTCVCVLHYSCTLTGVFIWVNSFLCPVYSGIGEYISLDLFRFVNLTCSCDFVRIYCCRFVLSWFCHFAIISFCHIVLICFCHFSISCFCHFVVITFCQFAMICFWHFILYFCHIVLICFWHFVLLYFCHIVLICFWHFVLLYFCHIVLICFCYFFL